ncbi:MAG: hypothetical protein WEB28_00410 [Nitrosopumilaceae archaeon]
MIMKIPTTDTRVLMLILVIGSIGGTFAIVQGLDLVSEKSPSMGGATMLAGNVKVTQFGPDGNVIAYRQTDNHIVKQGMEVIMSQVFGGVNGTYPDFVKGPTHPVRYMQIGTGADSGRLLYNDTNINTEIINAGFSCGRFPAGIINTTQDGAAHGYSLLDGSDDPTSPAPQCGTFGSGLQDCSAQMNVTATRQFLGGAPDNCAIPGIDEAGIFDNATSIAGGGFTGGYMFARNTFGSVDLGPLDTLQLDWEFTFTDS